MRSCYYSLEEEIVGLEPTIGSIIGSEVQRKVQNNYDSKYPIDWKIDFNGASILNSSICLRHETLISTQFRVRVGMKGYLTLLRSPELEPHHQMQLSGILRTGDIPKYGQPTHVDWIKGSVQNSRMFNICERRLQSRTIEMLWI